MKNNQTQSKPEGAEQPSPKGLSSSILFSRVCHWLNHIADQEMELAEKMASFRNYQDAAECERKARIYRLVKCVIEETHAEIQSENAKEQAAQAAPKNDGN
jgi:hypothetical protein